MFVMSRLRNNGKRKQKKQRFCLLSEIQMIHINSSRCDVTIACWRKSTFADAVEYCTNECEINSIRKGESGARCVILATMVGAKRSSASSYYLKYKWFLINFEMSLLCNDYIGRRSTSADDVNYFTNERKINSKLW